MHEKLQGLPRSNGCATGFRTQSCWSRHGSRDGSGNCPTQGTACSIPGLTEKINYHESGFGYANSMTGYFSDRLPDLVVRFDYGAETPRSLRRPLDQVIVI